MDFLKSAIAEYEDTLVGKRKSVSTFYFSYGESGNMKLALQIMQHAFETYLKWEPQVLRDYLTQEVLERLKLKGLLRYIVFPPELNAKEDLFYIAWLIYPQTVHYGKKDLTLRVYRKLLDKEIQKFPKEFFTGSEGVTRTQICLRYMVEHYLQITSVKELYAFFATEECIKTLRKYKLLTICRDLYDSPVEYLHSSISREQQDVFWFRYYDFQYRHRILSEQLPEEVDDE